MTSGRIKPKNVIEIHYGLNGILGNFISQTWHFVGLIFDILLARNLYQLSRDDIADNDELDN